MIKLYIQGFRGPWGWVEEYERTQTTFEIVPAKDADVIFHCDPTNWKKHEEYLGKKIIIANVLDFAEWMGGNPNTEEYVEKFCKKANYVTGISNNVLNQLVERGIKNPTMFHYPSQVSFDMINNLSGIPKRKHFISFCRLADQGKRMNLAYNSFIESGLIDEGFKYFFVGPEKPPFLLGKKGIVYLGFVDKETLYPLVASAKAVIMPSNGEGLGLPAIEGALLGTRPIVRNIKPMSDIFKIKSSLFDEDSELVDSMKFFSKYDKPIDNANFLNWERGIAFKLLTKKIELLCQLT